MRTPPAGSRHCGYALDSNSAATAVGGWLLAVTAVPIDRQTVLSETLVGGLLTGLTGSLPELVTTLAAVRMGALTLAVGDILGGNAVDALIVAMSDAAYRDGSIFASASAEQGFLLALAAFLTSVLLMGLVYRERHEIANIGLESFLVLAFYLGGFWGCFWASMRRRWPRRRIGDQPLCRCLPHPHPRLSHRDPDRHDPRRGRHGGICRGHSHAREPLFYLRFPRHMDVSAFSVPVRH